LLGLSVFISVESLSVEIMLDGIVLAHSPQLSGAMASYPDQFQRVFGSLMVCWADKVSVLIHL
jgi:hypothetical protein